MAAQVILNVQLNQNNALTTMQSIDKYAQKLNGTTIKLNIDTKGLDGLSNKMLTVLNNQAKAEISANKLAAAQANCSAQTTKSATQQARLAVEQTKANTAQTRAETAANKQAAALDKTTKSASLLGDSLGNVVLKMAAWQLIGNAIASVKNAFNDALTEMKAVDSELVTVRKVTGATTEELKGLEQQAYKVGSAYGVAASDYLSAVAEFSRAGYKDLAADLGELAIKTQLVGDVDQATANQFLLSVDAAYKYGGSVAELSKVLDGANEIDNNYATSIQKIAEGLGKVSPIAAQAHVSIGELSAGIGTITAVTQRSGSEAATALRALFLNIMGDTKTEIADGATWTAGEIENLRDVIKLYAKDAYDAAEATGSVINPMEAIAGLAQSMKDGLLTEQQLVEMVSDIGGKLRSSQLLALIQNWDMYKNMLADFGDSVGSADKEIENALDSWDRKTKILSNTWTEFIQKSISTDFVKGFLDAATAAIKFADNIGLVTVGLTGLILTFKGAKIVDKLTESFSSLKGSLTGLKGGFSYAVSWTGLLVTALTVAYAAYKKYIDGFTEAAEKQIEKSEKLKESAENITNLYSAYKSAEQGSDEYRDALGSLGEALGISESDIDSHKDKLAELTQSEILAAETAANTARILAEIAFEKSATAITFGTTLAIGNGGMADEVKEIMNAAAQIGSYGAAEFYVPKSNSADDILAYYNAINDAIKYYDDLAEKTKNDDIIRSETYQALLAIQTKLKESGADTLVSAQDREKEIALLKETFSVVEKGTINSQKSYDDYIKSIENATDKTEEEKKELVELAKIAFPQYSKSAEEAANQNKKVADSADEAKSAVEKFNDALKGGEKSDVYDQYVDAFKKVKEAAEAGLWGSTAFQEGIKLFANPEIIKQFGDDYKGLWDYMTSHGLGEVFGDADSKGTAFFNQMIQSADEVSDGVYKILDANGNLAASVERTADGFQNWFIDDSSAERLAESVAAISEATGYTEEAIYGMIGAWAEFDPSVDLSKLEEAKKLTEGTKEEAKKLGETKPNVETSTNAPETKQDIEGVTEAAKGVPTSVNTDVKNTADSAASSIRQYRGELDAIPKNKTTTITTNYVTKYTKRAKGVKGSSKETALVNDAPNGQNGKFPELVVQDGEAFIPNGGNPAIIDLKPGATVYTAKETEDILNGRKSIDSIPSYMGGKAQVYKGTSSSSSSKSSSSSRSGFSYGSSSYDDSDSGYIDETDYDQLADDLWRELEESVEWYLDQLQKQTEKQIEAIDDQIDALDKERQAQEETNELLEKQNTLAQSQLDLEKAKKQRTVRQYNAATGQWEWTQDQSLVSQAQESYDNAKKDLNDYLDELAYNATIAELNAQKEAIKAQYDAFKEEWENIRASVEKPAREIGDILADVATYGTPAMQSAINDVNGLLGNLGSALNSAISTIGQASSYASYGNNGSSYGGGGSSGGGTGTWYIPEGGMHGDGQTTGGFVYDPEMGGVYWDAGSDTSMPGVYSDPHAFFDNGGLAEGKGFMAKDVREPEIILDPEISKSILRPKSNSALNGFINALKIMSGTVHSSNPSMYSNNTSSNITNHKDSIYQIGNITVPQQYAERMPLSQCLSLLGIYANK